MIRLAIGTATALALAGCGSEQSGTFETEDGGEGNYTYEAESGDTTFKIETEDGVATFSSGSDAPKKLPAGFTVYPDATVLSSTVAQQGDGSATILILESGDAPADLLAHYRKQAEAAGVKIEMTMDTPTGTMLAGESEGGMTFSFNANRAEDVTTAQLSIGQDGGK